MRRAVVDHKRAVGELACACRQQPAPTAVEPLSMQLRVDRVSARSTGELEKAVVVVAPAERARAVSGGECGRLIEEEQFGELPRCQQR